MRGSEGILVAYPRSVACSWLVASTIGLSGNEGFVLCFEAGPAFHARSGIGLLGNETKTQPVVQPIHYESIVLDPLVSSFRHQSPGELELSHKWKTADKQALSIKRN